MVRLERKMALGSAGQGSLAEFLQVLHGWVVFWMRGKPDHSALLC